MKIWCRNVNLLTAQCQFYVSYLPIRHGAKASSFLYYRLKGFKRHGSILSVDLYLSTFIQVLADTVLKASGSINLVSTVSINYPTTDYMFCVSPTKLPNNPQGNNYINSQ